MRNNGAIDNQARRMKASDEGICWRSGIAGRARQIAIGNQLLLLFDRENTVYLTLLDGFGRPKADVCIPERAVVIGFRAVVIIRTKWEDVYGINPAIG